MVYSIEELFDLQMGKTPSRNNFNYWNTNDNKWVSISDLSKAGRYIYETKEYISDNAIAESGIKVIPANTVIMSFKLSIGKVAITKEKMYSNEAIMAFHDKHTAELLPEYIYYLFQNIDWSIATNKSVMGKTLNKTSLSQMKISVCSIQKQREIVSVLNKVTGIIDNMKDQISLLDDLIKSRFVEMFGDLKKNDRGWEVCSFTDFAKIDTIMIHDFEGYEDFPHIGIDSIEKETGNISGYRTIKEDGVISGKYLFTPDHIIYSKIRPNLNKVALPDFKGVCSADAYPIFPKKERCNRIFLAYTMRSPIFLDYILAFSNRTNLPKVNKVQVEGFYCPMPDIVLQDKFADFVRKVDKLKVEEQKRLEKSQLLFDSLMQKYFG